MWSVNVNVPCETRRLPQPTTGQWKAQMSACNLTFSIWPMSHQNTHNNNQLTPVNFAESHLAVFQNTASQHHQTNEHLFCSFLEMGSTRFDTVWQELNQGSIIPLNSWSVGQRCLLLVSMA